MHSLAPIYLIPLDPNSVECDNLKGNNVFKYFENVMAADVVKVCFLFLIYYISIFFVFFYLH